MIDHVANSVLKFAFRNFYYRQQNYTIFQPYVLICYYDFFLSFFVTITLTSEMKVLDIKVTEK